MPVMPNLLVKPAPPLSRFVQLLWYYQDARKPHAKERLLPDGCVSLVINLAEDQTRIYDPDDIRKITRLGGCGIAGPQSKCFAIDTDEQTCVVGVSFRAGGAVPFLKLPSDELHNQHLNLEDLWGRLGRELRERTLAAKTPEAKLRVVELMLLERAAGLFDGQPVVDYAVQNFLAQPATSKIADVAGKSGFSSRRFIELFKQHVGMTPKLFCRVRRFQNVLRRITQGRPLHWSEIALDGGYFDQAHFIHDFRAFSGINPSKYLADYKDFPRHHNHLPIV
jgi:AraC-like DNA-binding protein